MRRPRPATIEPCEPRRLLAAINSGQRLDGSISSSGEVDAFTIAVSAAKPLLIVDVATTGGSLRAVAQVLDPNGDDVSVFSSADGVAFVDARVAGTYTVHVRDQGGGDRTGDYRLSVFTPGASAQFDDDGDDASDTRDDANVDSGRRYAATVGPGDLDAWRIDAVAGQALTVTVGRNQPNQIVDPVITLIAPDGTIVAREQARVDTRATQTGSYFAIVTEAGNDEQQVYGISFARAPGAQYTGDADTLSLASGVSRSGDLPSGDTDVFTIVVEPGATIDVALGVTGTTAPGFVPTLALYGPDGRTVRSAVGNSGGASISSYAATVGGTYYLSLRDDDRDGGGTFSLRYDLSAGNGLTGSIADGILNVDGTTGDDRITVTRGTVDGYDALLANVNGTTRAFYAGEVRSLEVQGDDGDDKLDVGTLSVNSYLGGGSGNDTLQGGSGRDTLTAGAGGNRVNGGDGDDRLNGSGGRDFLFGEGGNDRLYGNGGNDYMDGGGNIDRLFAGDGDDQLFGGSSNDRLFGDAGNDTLAGGSGKDYLFGGDGTDTVFNGGADGDVLDSIERT